MKNTDKITLTIGHLKKLIKESKSLNDFVLDTNKEYTIVDESVLFKHLGLFDYIDKTEKMDKLVFRYGVVFCPTFGALKGFTSAIAINGDRLYFMTQNHSSDSLKEAIEYCREYAPLELDYFLNVKKQSIGIINHE